MIARKRTAAQTPAEWLANYARGEAEQEDRERKARRGAFKWYLLMRKTMLDNHAEKHVLRCLADHAWAGPDYDDRGRRDGECVLLVSTIVRETASVFG